MTGRAILVCVLLILCGSSGSAIERSLRYIELVEGEATIRLRADGTCYSSTATGLPPKENHERAWERLTTELKVASLERSGVLADIREQIRVTGTVVAEPSGIVVLQPFADDGLASGGTGDVLSGMIGGLLAQGMAPFAAALLGTYLHGRSREERRDLTGAYFSAADLIAGIDPALRALGGG